LITDPLNEQKSYTRSRLTADPLITPLMRIIGGADLWGRVDSFLRFAEAAERSPDTIRGYRTKLEASNYGQNK